MHTRVSTQIHTHAAVSSSVSASSGNTYDIHSDIAAFYLSRMRIVKNSLCSAVSLNSGHLSRAVDVQLTFKIAKTCYNWSRAWKTSISLCCSTHHYSRDWCGKAENNAFWSKSIGLLERLTKQGWLLLELAQQRLQSLVMRNWMSLRSSFLETYSSLLHRFYLKLLVDMQI